MRILVGDIGGTNTRLALFEQHGRWLLEQQTFASQQHKDLISIIKLFMKNRFANVACFGIAGPIENGVCRATNLPWIVDTKDLETRTKISSVYLINDLLANAYGVRCLQKKDLLVLQKGKETRGNQALISPGTGLGQAGMVLVNNSLHPFASEAGHADFAPTSVLQEQLLQFLRKTIGEHVSYERVLSGPGLANIYRFLVEEKRRKPANPPLDIADLPRYITENACNNRCVCCKEAMEIFLTIYGAEAGNLALRFFAVSGVYLGGGIVPHIVPLLQQETFKKSFCAKGRFQSFLEKVPVHIILNDKTAVLGALEYALEKSVIE